MKRLTSSLVGISLLAGPIRAGLSTPPPPERPAPVAEVCSVTAPAYYTFPLVTTRTVPATGRSTGTVEMTFASSPYGVALDPEGNYVYDLHLSLERVRDPGRGVYVAWVTTPEVDEIRRIGPLDDDMRATGRVSWNKFLVVVTLEPSDDPTTAVWSGPIAFRGMSRSGRMHTMAGHGPFEDEKCATYGYSN
ncbi:MAG: hypothetical protein OEZ65_02780 [Gemmatimonadota bacterium]|nr:hypothetical protein [Gemmatimonadota bacterium]MDH5758488.1 hypothetical protein [Gemmatimonadota bacterium]